MSTWDPAIARVEAILQGAWPPDPLGTSDRRLPAGTFAPGVYRLPSENPKYPAVSFERRYEFEITNDRYDGIDPGAEDQSQGPHLLVALATLTISYALLQGPSLAPPPGRLDMGALKAVSIKAHDDWDAIRWALFYYRNWVGVTPTLRQVRMTPEGASSGRAPGDPLRYLIRVPLLVSVQTDGVSYPGLGT